MPADPLEEVRRLATSPEVYLVGGGALAAVARLALYSGPPRPRKIALLDGLATAVLGFAAGEAAFWWTSNEHASLAAGVVLGVLGWNEIRHWAWVARMKAGGTP